MTAARARPPDLPDFERPPVTEVALSIQFDRLTKISAIHGGLLWTVFKDQYPLNEVHAPLAPAFEVFGPNPAITAFPQIELSTGAPDIRYWFVRNDGSQLLQFQPDRLVHNWRKREDTDEYPRYETIKDEFAKEIAKVQEFLSGGDLGEIRPNQCEVTYINHIVMPGDDDARQSPQRVLSFWGDRPIQAVPQFESAAVRLSYLLGENGKHPGRLHVQVNPGLRRKDLKPLLALTLTARGKPESESIDGAFKFLDMGRRAIVRGFKGLTTEEMHNVWGIKR